MARRLHEQRIMKKRILGPFVLVLLYGTLPAAAQTPVEDESRETVSLRVLANGELVPDDAEGRRYLAEQNARNLTLRRQADRRTRFGLAFGLLSVAGSIAGWVFGLYQCFGADFDDECEATATPWVFALGGILTAVVSFAIGIGGGARRRKLRRYRVGPVALNLPDLE